MVQESGADTGGEVARFGALSVIVSNGASVGSTRSSAPHTRHLTGSGPYRVVVQKGRSFQRANPHVPVHVNCGRYLVIELPHGTSLKRDPSFTIVEPGTFVGFDVERVSPRAARQDIVQILGTVTEPDLRQRVETLAALPHTRHSRLPRLEAALTIATTWLREAHCEVSRHELPLPGGGPGARTANLVGRKAGSGQSPRLLVIGGHLDSVNHDGDEDAPAPGADDNASGSATVAAIAAAVGELDLRDDVDFVLFGGEEQGLFGSRHYVNRLSSADRTRLAGMINIDMAASRNTEELSVLLEGAPGSRGVIDALAAAAATYTPLATQVPLQPFASDHVPFIQAGLPAVLTIEGTDGAFEHEHTARDTPDRLDFALHRAITCLDLAWLLEQALPA